FFPHKKMVDALSAAAFENSLARAFHGSEEVLCQGCHHNAPVSEKPAPCVRCHPASRSQKSDARPDLMGAYHLQCMACHTAMEVELDGECAACHAPLTAVSSQ
ncbi:MAG: cytochrome c family protein, partial [Desulfobacterales bacterium]|nr:cytochrome c family protein [Desulfobacterales bacterium]